MATGKCPTRESHISEGVGRSVSPKTPVSVWLKIDNKVLRIRLVLESINLQFAMNFNEYSFRETKSIYLLQ
jgi:hypothetical protein